MFSSERLHLKVNKFLLECIGLWPYQLETKKRRNYLVFATCNLSLLAPLALGLLEMPDKNDVLFFGTIAAIIYLGGGFYIAALLYLIPHSLTRLYQQIETDLIGITRKEELAIMAQSSRRATSLILIFIGMAILAVVLFITFNYLPLLFTNAQAYSTMFTNYSNGWIINENLRRIQKIVHFSLVALYTSFVYIASVGVYISSIKHTCGMYAIASYRLRKVMREKNVGLKEKTEKEIIAELLDIITMHREAIKSVRILNKAFKRISYIAQVFGLICFAIFIFALQLSVQIKSIHLALRVVSWGVVFVVYIFYLNYGGEQIIEFSNSVFTATYFVDWHLMTIEARKILLMIIMRSGKGDALSHATITLSLENFAKIMYISWSMAAVLLSRQEDA